ncbi:universal stress protein [Mangrovimonas spongiae]|uniref:Universal stress protein n=1 Tax=Mangrovimonas spongiae TaxID=2494697 RepID=A0A428K5C3_9FLAO|nr:universal stress protein [Mangrovimonas spongiae]RSK41644.1 universal stress protein [Mangrovimonas spongiae]
MGKPKHKILLLADLKTPVEDILKSTVSLAKIIHADIELFHVKQLTDIVKRESQLSAMRTLNETHSKTDKKLLSLIEPISKTYNVTINYNYVFGNVKTEIDNYIEAQKPDIVVLGKRNKLFNPLGNNITDFVLKQFKGTVIIANNNNLIDFEKGFNFGVFNVTNEFQNQMFIKDLMAYINKPLKSFQIAGEDTEKIKHENDVVEHIFDQGNNVIKNISNYLLKSNINLLCVERDTNNSSKTSIKDIVSNLNVPLFITGNRNYYTS